MVFPAESETQCCTFFLWSSPVSHLQSLSADAEPSFVLIPARGVTAADLCIELSWRDIQSHCSHRLVAPLSFSSTFGLWIFKLELLCWFLTDTVQLRCFLRTSLIKVWIISVGRKPRTWTWTSCRNHSGDKRGLEPHQCESDCSQSEMFEDQLPQTCAIHGDAVTRQPAHLWRFKWTTTKF